MLRKEIRAYGQALLRPVLTTPRFLIFAQGRTGTWLLYSLLNLHPQVYCEKEILMDKVRWPYLYTQGRSCRHPHNVYGCHVQINQLINTQGIAPKPYITQLVNTGWKIIYLRRDDIVRQSVSTMIAMQKREWIVKQGETLSPQKYYIDPKILLSWLQRRVDHAAQEISILEDVEHIILTYEVDLLSSATHQTTMDKVFSYLNLPVIDVEAPTQRLSGDRLADSVVNYQEIATTILNSKFAQYLEPDEKTD